MVQRKKSDHGSGSIQERPLKNGSSSYKLRYYVDGKRHSKTVRGTKAEAKRELRRLMKAADDGNHIALSRLTLTDWADRWYALKERGDSQAAATTKRTRGLVSPRTLERYKELMRIHVLPSLGDRPIQKITVGEIDDLYIKLEEHLSASTVRHVHVVMGACFSTAVRKGILSANPVERADPPLAKAPESGQALDQEELTTLLRLFQKTPLFLLVALAAGTGMRRNELLALQWTDIDFDAEKISVSKALEETKANGLRVKGPKTARGNRVIGVDAGLVALLREERDLHKRLVAGVTKDDDIDLELINLPAEALVFPALPDKKGTIDPTRHRLPHGITQGFIKRARSMGFENLRLHDLRMTHGTLLLNAGVPVHEVARRLGHDPAVLLKTYAKVTREADEASTLAAGAIMRSGIVGAI